MDTSPSNTVDNAELQILILVSIQTLKINNKKCGTEEVFKLVLESLESDKILGLLIKNRKVKTSCYANKTCLPIPRVDQINNIHTTHTSSVIQATSVKTQQDNINMNQDSTINNITKAQNITQAITNTDVPPTSKENKKTNQILKIKLILSAENLQNKTNRMEILNLKENQS